MEGIEFETDQESTGTKPSYVVTPKKTSLMLRILANVGIDDVPTANFILLGIAALFSGVTIFLYAEALVAPKADRAAEAQALLNMQNNR